MRRWSESFKNGVYLVIALVFLTILYIGYRQIRFLHSLDSEHRRNEAISDLKYKRTEKGVRGDILDRNHNILATSLLRHNVQAHLVPNLCVVDFEATARSLSPIIGMSEEDIYKNLQLSAVYKESYATLMTNVPDDVQRKMEIALFDRGNNEQDPLCGVVLTYDNLHPKYSLQAFLKPLDEVNDVDKVVKSLGPVLKKSSAELRNRLTSNNNFVYLLRDVPDEVCLQVESVVRANKLRGIRIVKDRDGKNDVQAILKPFKSVADPEKASEILGKYFKVSPKEFYDVLNSDEDVFYFDGGYGEVYQKIIDQHKTKQDKNDNDGLDPLEGIDVCSDPIRRYVILAYIEKRPVVKDPIRVAEELAPILEESKESILKKLDSEGGAIPFSYVYKNVPEHIYERLLDKFAEIEETKKSKKEALEKSISDQNALRRACKEIDDKYRYLEGIEISYERNEIRSHPQGGLASQILGYIGESGESASGFVKTGLESSIDAKLTPKGVSETILVDRDQRPIYEMYGGDKNNKKGKMGYDAVLTIDMRIQKIVEEELAAKVNSYRKVQEDARNRARGDYKPCDGVCIILDARTAEVLAMASYPGYIPDEYFKAPPENLINKAIQTRYEPGSIFKTFLAGTALHNGITSDTYFPCGETFNAAGVLLGNSHAGAPASATLKQIITDSWNTGSSRCAVSMGEDKYKAGIKSFGFYNLTGIELPGELYGDMGDNNGKDPWNYVDFCVRAYGQALAVTPMQLVSGLQAVANDGKRMRPHIVKEYIDRSDRSRYPYVPELLSQPLTANEAKELRNILANVITEGTGGKAMIKGYKAGGKTGTANTYQDNGQLADDYYSASFMGIVPIDKPSIVVFVKFGNVDRSLGLEYGGGQVAAPVFSKICEKVLPLVGVKPTPGYIQAK